MYAGKTTKLLKTLQKRQEQGRTTCLIKHSSDERYSSAGVVTHDHKLSVEANSVVKRLSEVRLEVATVGVDELHFFEDAVSVLKAWVE